MPGGSLRWFAAFVRLAEVSGVAIALLVRVLSWRIRGWITGHSSPRRLGDLLADACERLGGAFVKIGQAVAFRPDVLTEEVRTRLERLCDQVTPSAWPDFVAGRAHIARVPRRFAAFDRKPIASGCIAQVYRATTVAGVAVAVKIRRPAAVLKFSRDVALARAAVRALGWLPFIRGSGIVEAVELTTVVLLEQLDFTIEAARWRLTRDNLARSNGVIVPRILSEFCGEDVLVSEFVDGLTPAAAGSLGSKANRDVARQCLRVLYQMLFIDGLVHGDLHPGNLLATPDGRVVVLDFGICDELSLGTRRALAEFFLGLASGRGDECARVALHLATRLPATLDRQAFAGEMSDAVAAAANTVAEFGVGRFAAQMFRIQRRHGIRSTAAFTRGICALLVLEGTLKCLAPNLNFKTEAWPFVLSACSPQRPRVPA